MGMTQVGFRWQETGKNLDYKTLADEIAPYMLYCIDKFGTRRCMFESNFPVDKTSYSYRTLWNAFKHLTKSMSKQERMDLFHDTAIRVYRLKV
jgi:predicted TIM-barrel fold metal-dependent hydrolase